MARSSIPTSYKPKIDKLIANDSDLSAIRVNSAGEIRRLQLRCVEEGRYGEDQYTTEFAGLN